MKFLTICLLLLSESALAVRISADPAAEAAAPDGKTKVEEPPVRDLIIPAYVKTNDANVVKVYADAVKRENEDPIDAVEQGYAATRYSTKFGPGEALHPGTALKKAIATADAEDALWRKTEEGKRLAKAEEDQKNDKTKSAGLTITGKEEYKVPKFLPDRQTDAEIAAGRNIGQNPNRPPDEALPHPETHKTSKDEDWVTGMKEKYLN